MGVIPQAETRMHRPFNLLGTGREANGQNSSKQEKISLLTAFMAFALTRSQRACSKFVKWEHLGLQISQDMHQAEDYRSSARSYNTGLVVACGPAETFSSDACPMKL